MLKKNKKEMFLVTDKEYLGEVYKKSGKPATKIDRQKIHWVGE